MQKGKRVEAHNLVPSSKALVPSSFLLLVRHLLLLAMHLLLLAFNLTMFQNLITLADRAAEVKMDHCTRHVNLVVGW